LLKPCLTGQSESLVCFLVTLVSSQSFQARAGIASIHSSSSVYIRSDLVAQTSNLEKSCSKGCDTLFELRNMNHVLPTCSGQPHDVQTRRMLELPFSGRSTIVSSAGSQRGVGDISSAWSGSIH
jgi:hypothetical protein